MKMSATVSVSNWIEFSTERLKVLDAVDAYPPKCQSSSCNDSKMAVTKVKFTPLHSLSGNSRQGDQR